MSTFATRTMTLASSRVTQASEAHAARSLAFQGTHYLMTGVVSGSPVQWVVSGTPDTTGANYPGGSTPTHIVTAAGPF